jgi:hypothetical protein
MHDAGSGKRVAVQAQINEDRVERVIAVRDWWAGVMDYKVPRKLIGISFTAADRWLLCQLHPQQFQWPTRFINRLRQTQHIAAKHFI